LEKTLKIIQFQSPCYGRGHLPPDQVAQSPIQPGFELFQLGKLESPPTIEDTVSVHIFFVVIFKLIYHSATGEQIQDDPNPPEGKKIKKISSMPTMHSIFYLLFSLSCLITLLIHPPSDSIKCSQAAQENKLPPRAVQIDLAGGQAPTLTPDNTQKRFTHTGTKG